MLKIKLEKILIHIWILIVFVHAEQNIVDDVKDEFHQLVERVNIIENQHAIQKQIVEELKEEIFNLKGDVRALQRQNAGKDRVISKLRKMMNRRSVISWPDERPEETNSNQKRTEGVKLNRIRQTENEVFVAFSACLSHSVQHLGPNQNVVFDHVETNTGNAYNSHHGVFIAPVSGIYMFHYSILSYNKVWVECSITVNGTRRATISARDPTSVDQSSQMWIVQLHRGADVAIQNVAEGGEIYSDIYLFSTFSGVLLRQDLADPNSIVG